MWRCVQKHMEPKSWVWGPVMSASTQVVLASYLITLFSPLPNMGGKIVTFMCQLGCVKVLRYVVKHSWCLVRVVMSEVILMMEFK